MKTEKELAELREKMLELKKELMTLEPEEVERLMEDLPVEEKDLETISAAGYVAVPAVTITMPNVVTNIQPAVMPGVNVQVVTNPLAIVNSNSVTITNDKGNGSGK